MSDAGPDNAERASKTRRTFRAVLPQPLQELYDISGISALIIFVFGFITAAGIAAGVFYSGKIPLFLVPDDYKKASPSTDSGRPPEPETRVKPSSIEVHTVGALPDWLNPIKNWLQSEAGRRESENLISGSMTEAIETEELPATNDFKWVLKASSADYKIVGWAFRVTSAAQSKHVVPLERKKGQDDRDSILFEVPKCEKGDRLIAVIRVSWENNVTPVDFPSTFRSTVE